jgi:spore coat protein W
VQELWVGAAYADMGINLKEGAIQVSDSSQDPKIPNAIIDLLVSDLLRKNGINIEGAKGNLSDEQKQMLKDLVNDLTQQVEKFVKPPSSDNN